MITIVSTVSSIIHRLLSALLLASTLGGLFHRYRLLYRTVGRPQACTDDRFWTRLVLDTVGGLLSWIAEPTAMTKNGF